MLFVLTESTNVSRQTPCDG